jgi:phenylacetate-CoA ligase
VDTAEWEESQTAKARQPRAVTRTGGFAVGRLINSAKRLAERLPEPLARAAALVPFSIRFGATYTHTQRLARDIGRATSVARDQFALEGLRSIVTWANDRVDLYRELFAQHRFDPRTLGSLADFALAPIISKDCLRSFPIEGRSVRFSGRLHVNTGGTSGSPLDFYLDGQAFAREWAHMHLIWMARGYRPSHAKLTLRGRDLGTTLIRYNAVHNEYIVNSYQPIDRVAPALRRVLDRARIRWVHGYPSLVAEFATRLFDCDSDLSERLAGGLDGVLLGSEYPAPMYRSVIEERLSRNVVSWYGHSEMAILAFEREPYVYEAMPTYGLAEAVPSDDGSGASRLVVTSFANKAHPFIRYDTGDRVEQVPDPEGRFVFRIKEGRVGDFVVTRTGQRIALTALIFGRHHSAFDHLRHVQVRQQIPGVATLVVVPKSSAATPARLLELFNLANVDIRWDVELVPAPVRTASGKIALKLNGSERGSD